MKSNLVKNWLIFSLLTTFTSFGTAAQDLTGTLGKTLGGASGGFTARLAGVSVPVAVQQDLIR